MLAVTAMGVVFMVAFMLNERICTRYPLFPSRFLGNRTLLIIVFIDFLYFVSQFVFLYRQSLVVGTNMKYGVDVGLDEK